MKTPAITCQNVRKTFRQRIVPISRLQDSILQRHRTNVMQIDAVNDISLTVSEGEWLGIYGENGSGKTTLLKMIAGLLVPDSGTVTVHGTMSSFFDLGIGFHPERNARENIRIHGLLQGMAKHTIEKTMNDIIAFADIGDHASLPMKCLSTGMSMRLAFAAAAEAESDTYIFDEVLAVGDAGFQKKCLEHFKNLRARKKSVIIVSHNAHQLYQLTDRGLTLEEGKIKGEWKGGYNETYTNFDASR